MLSISQIITKPRILLLVVMTTGSLHGQATDNSISFSCSSWDRMQGPKLLYLPTPRREGESMESVTKRLTQVDIAEMTRSLPYEFKGGRTIAFFRKQAAGGTTGGLENFASVTIPAGWDRVLLLFLPTGKDGEYKIFPLRDDREHAPFGSYQFVNLSNQPLEGFIDKNPISLKAGGRSIIKLTGNEPRPLNFGVWATIEGKRKWLQRNTLTYRPSKYLIYFFHSGTDQMGRLKIESRGIVDFRKPVEVEQQ